MAIRRSAAAEIEQLLADLCGGDAVARETAAARLTVIGVRAVPHLIVAFDRAALGRGQGGHPEGARGHARSPQRRARR